MSSRVLIAGAGLGGLTLAHGLRNAGLDVAVFEAGHSRLDPATSYRIHIDASGSRALHACLPPDLWGRFTAQSGVPPRGIAFTTERLRQLAFIPEPDSASDSIGHSHPISRTGLRQLLLSGLEDVVTFDKRLVRYTRAAERQVTAHFADGSTASGDVLVGADGSNSAVRKQLLPEAVVVDTGAAGIAGKLYLTQPVRKHVPSELLSQMTMVLPSRGLGMFMATFQRQAGLHHTNDPDYPEHLFWVLLGPACALGLTAPIHRRPAAELQQFALHKVRPWHPFLPWLVAQSDPSSVVGVPLYTSRPIGAWQTINVTLLGDAIHTMPPLQGLGGNTALRDAAVLCHRLVEADRGRAVVSAIGAYEQEMLGYGFDSVRRSVQTSDAIASTSPLGRIAFRSVLRAADRLPPLHRALFRRPASGVDWRSRNGAGAADSGVRSV